MPSVDIEQLDIDDPWDQIDCGADVLVAIDDTFIPTTKIEAHVAADGVSDEQHLCEVHFPESMGGISVTDRIRQFSGSDQKQYSIGDVFFRFPQLGESSPYFLLFRGWVRSTGAGNDVSEARLFIDDIANLLPAISFSQHYNDPTLTQIFRDALTEIRNRTIFSDVQFGVVSDGEELPTDASFIAGLFLVDSINDAVEIVAEKSFKRNRDTVADALNWAASKGGGRFYFSVNEGRQPVLVYEPSGNSQKQFVGEHVDASDAAEVVITENKALEELSPINQIRVHGSSAMGVGGFNVKQLQSGSFPIAVASYPPLQERQGMALEPPVVDSDARSADKVGNVARKELVSRLSDVGGGDMFLLGRPDVNLHDEIRTRPLCRGEEEVGKTPPVSYQVNRVTHTAEGGETYQTRVNVGAYIDHSEIEVETHMRSSN